MQLRLCILQACLFGCLLFTSNLHGISPGELAVVFNTADEDSQKIAEYYQQQRNIPPENMIAVEFAYNDHNLTAEQFKSIYQQVRLKTPKKVQFFALAWRTPHRVECMSITSAFAFGFDKKYCAQGCRQTAPNLFFNSNSRKPSDELGVRPAIMLAGSSVEQVKAMIGRGVASDATFPLATAYLLSTSDKARNVRSRFYDDTIARLGNRLSIQQLNADVLEDKQDVMFYFTGLVRVDRIDSNWFVPGAMADHLTSAGGDLVGDKQMSILHWLDAGATGSYGTVVEPCAFAEKFPHPGVVIDRYTRGESLIEAYWKSVKWPGQGLFVGEPMATPYAVRRGVH